MELLGQVFANIDEMNPSDCLFLLAQVLDLAPGKSTWWHLHLVWTLVAEPIRLFIGVGDFATMHFIVVLIGRSKLFRGRRKLAETLTAIVVKAIV